MKMENVNFGVSWVELLDAIENMIENGKIADQFSEVTLDILLLAIKNA